MNKKLNILIIDNNEFNIIHATTKLEKTFEKLKTKGIEIQRTFYPDDGAIESFLETLNTKASQADLGDISYLSNFIFDYIEEKDINVILLDFYLTQDEEDSPPRNIDDSIGIKLLIAIKDNKKFKNMPIIGFSIANDQTSRRSTVQPNLVMNLFKGFNADYLVQNLGDLYKLLRAVDEYKKDKERYVDIAILCVVEVEFEMLKEVFDLKGNPIKILDQNYYMSELKVDDKKVKIVLKYMNNDMGMVEAATHTSNLIKTFNPKYIAMTGICAGIDEKKQKLGDIVIPHYAWNWQAGKYKNGDSEQILKNNLYKKYFKSNMRQKEISEFMKTKIELLNKSFLIESHEKYKKIFQNGKNELEKYQSSIEEETDNSKIKKMKSIKNSFKTIMNSNQVNVSILNGKLISGSAVVANKVTLEKAIGDETDINGLDMETYGVYYAAKKLGVDDIISIKSICDFADEYKSDIYQPYCAYMSAATLKELIINHLFKEKE